LADVTKAGRPAVLALRFAREDRTMNAPGSIALRTPDRRGDRDIRVLGTACHAVRGQYPDHGVPGHRGSATNAVADAQALRI